ncbi:MAG TPA: hypothetical protein VNZ45_15450, partial [Bacteroidia bacterium]|nr:hypothetical protein [Bacteroidia bacterium]
MIDAIKLSKLGSDGIFDKAEGSSILPNIDSQSKWQFARTPGHIHLTDGMTVHVFYLPEGEKTEDFPAHKVQDVPIIDFGKDHTSKGTAQVHRANPGLIYFTMQDGHANPTYTFKHTNSHEWHAIPKKRKVQQFTNAPTTSTPPIQETTNTIQVDSKAFENGVKDKLASFDGILDASLKGIHSLSRGAVRGLDTM